MSVCVCLLTPTWGPGRSLHSRRGTAEDRSSPLFYLQQTTPDSLWPWGRGQGRRRRWRCGRCRLPHPLRPPPSDSSSSESTTWSHTPDTEWELETCLHLSEDTCTGNTARLRRRHTPVQVIIWKWCLKAYRRPWQHHDADRCWCDITVTSL